MVNGGTHILRLEAIEMCTEMKWYLDSHLGGNLESKEIMVDEKRSSDKAMLAENNYS